MTFSLVLSTLGFASELNRDAKIRAQEQILQKYRDRQQEAARTNRKIVANLTQFANLPFIPAPYRASLANLIETLKSPVVEE